VADLGRTYQSKRKPSHITAEASRLREMVQEREEEIKRLREAMADAAFAFDQGRTQDAHDALRSALDGGGGSP
jgi:hypothetical protein